MNEFPEAAGPEPGRARWPLWARLLLAGSLALNLLFVGLAMGIWWRVGDHAGHDLAGPRGASALVFALEKSDRRTFWRDLRAVHGAERAARPDPAVLLDMLRADPPDLDALAAAVSAEAGHRHARQAQIQKAWLDRIAAMSAQERARYADRLEQIWKTRRPRH